MGLLHANVNKFIYFIMLLLFVAQPVSAGEDKCSKHKLHAGLMFELSINNSLRDDLLFRFCIEEDAGYLFAELQQHGFIWREQIRPDYVFKSEVKLSPKKTEKLKDMYLAAMIHSKSDQVRGLDGSTWCFRPKSGMSYTEFCYWSPTLDDSEREVKHINDLGIYLLILSGLEKEGASIQ
ncbi:hypothetical protein [Rheinheimera soli]|uniref:hypothetical protein n=1 Tax=Rheinheimera soli TaxID=443616 RepID=UPI001E6508AA|nr:hypothetical protein [Rheinheimera soli]